MSFFSSSYRRYRLSCFGTSCYCWRLSMCFFASCRLNCWSTFSTSNWGFSMSFFSSIYRSCRRFCVSFFTSYRSSFCMCFRTSSYCRFFSSTSGRSFSMSFFVRYRSSFRTCVNSWGLSMSFFTSCWSYRSAFSTSCYSWRFSMGFFTNYRCSFCMCFRTSSYCRSTFSVSFFTCYRSCFSTSCYSWSTFIRCRSSWLFSCTSNCRSRCSFRTSIYRGLSMSFFTCYRSSFGTSYYCRSWRFSMSFFSRASRWNFSVSFFISHRSCRLFCSSVRRSFSMSFLSCTSSYSWSAFSTSSSW